MVTVSENGVVNDDDAVTGVSATYFWSQVAEEWRLGGVHNDRKETTFCILVGQTGVHLIQPRPRWIVSTNS